MKHDIEINRLIDHLFRHEAGKLVAVLSRTLGTENLDLEEDVVQDASIEAMNQWGSERWPSF